MKIKSEDNIYNIPIKNGSCIVTSDYLEDIVQCLSSYFISNKKNKCIVLDDDGDLCKYSEVAFIYVPYNEEIYQIYKLKPKTQLNNEITNFIDANQEMFRSIEAIRNNLNELLTDVGVFKIKNIMQKSLDGEINFIVDDYDVSKIISSISVDSEKLSHEQLFIALYNLLLYVNREKFCIVYIDFEVDDLTLKWIKNIKTDNTLILIKNASIVSKEKEFIDYMLVISKANFVEEMEFSRDVINDLSYCLHPYILKNVEYQIEKNIKLMNLFKDDSTTFLIKFTDNSAL